VATENPALADVNRAGIRHAEHAVHTRATVKNKASERLAMSASGAIVVIRKNASEEIRVEISNFSGHDLVNLRVWVDPRNGGRERIPRKAGIACNVRLLPDLIETPRRAEIHARDRGFL
jgi:hypothetical protein